MRISLNWREKQKNASSFGLPLLIINITSSHKKKRCDIAGCRLCHRNKQNCNKYNTICVVRCKHMSWFCAHADLWFMKVKYDMLFNITWTRNYRNHIGLCNCAASLMLNCSFQLHSIVKRTKIKSDCRCVQRIQV